MQPEISALIPPGGRVLCFAAHPDDETIGAGGQFRNWQDLRIVHATDGAPYNLEDTRRNGFAAREDYAEARRKELWNALRIAGIHPEQCSSLGLVDQESCRHLVELVYRVILVLEENKPATVLSPPYEGGHPDHDSLAFGVHAACRTLAHRRLPRPAIIEYGLYHAVNGEFRAGEFLPFAGGETVEIRLSGRVASMKQQMLDCFVTQQEILAAFRSPVEKFRRAPDYDFTQPPHAGQLFYEKFNWGVTGAEWRELAAAATRALE